MNLIIDYFKTYSLSDFDLIGEPYINVNFDEVYYLTNTGYAWDGGKCAVRDVVENHFDLSFHKTDEIIIAVQSDTFPHKCLILAHTLWTDSLLQWVVLHLREFVRNHIKSIARQNICILKVYAFLVKLYWKR